MPDSIFAGRYEIREVLGEGGRKQTYLAWDSKMRRLVALAVVRPEAVEADPGGAEREAVVLGRIGRHPNIVSLYDYDMDIHSSVQYMVSEYLSGGTLAAHLEGDGPLTLEQVLRLGRQVCRGLAHLHRQGLIHRDVCPKNVLLDERQGAHLGDFDSAIPRDTPAEIRPVTTLAWASPEEQAQGHLDVRTDLYSLGGVLCAAVTGACSPQSGDDVRMLRQIVPSSLTELIEDLLAYAPDDRPADAETVLKRLGEIADTADIDALIAGGESGIVEFKSSLHHRHGPFARDLQQGLDAGKIQEAQAKKETVKRLNHEVTKTIAAFLNSEGGTLVIGVDDGGIPLGITHDFEYCEKGKGDLDGWTQSLRQVIANALGNDVWTAVRIECLTYREEAIGVVYCLRRDTPTWHKAATSGAECEHFFIRAGNTTEEMTGRCLVSYVTEHWPA